MEGHKLESIIAGESVVWLSQFAGRLSGTEKEMSVSLLCATGGGALGAGVGLGLAMMKEKGEEDESRGVGKSMLIGGAVGAVATPVMVAGMKMGPLIETGVKIANMFSDNIEFCGGLVGLLGIIAVVRVGSIWVADKLGWD